MKLKNKKLTYGFLGFAVVLIATIAYAAAGDRYIYNQNPDGDINIVVNDGGVDTTVLTAEGATSNLKVDTDTLVVDSANDRVGVKTASPDSDVHLLGSAPEIRLEDTSGTTSAAPRVKFYENGTELGAVGDTASLRSALMFSTNTGKDMMFFTDNQNTSTDTPRMTIDSTGNTTIEGDLTVNKATGNANLTVDGNINATSGTVRILHQSGTIANGASLPDIEVGSSGLLYSGTIHAWCMQSGDINDQTYRMYHTSGRGNTAVFTIVNEHLRVSGCSFTVSRPIDRFARLTNTSGVSCACAIAYFGVTT